MLYQQLGQILLDCGCITREQLNSALTRQAQSRESLPDILFALGDTTPAAVSQALEARLGIGFSDLENEILSPEAARLLPRILARKHRMVPIRIAGNALLLAMADPLDLAAADEAVLAARMGVKPLLASPEAIDRAISRAYGAAAALEALGELPAAPNPPEPVREEAAGPAVRAVNGILEHAFSLDASDVHLEPREACLAVRMRIDGHLREEFTLPVERGNPILARVKVMGNLDIAEHRIPQDGHSRIRFHTTEIDLRISTMPTIWGEKAVIRLLHKSPALLTPAGLGFRGQRLTQFHSLLETGSGMILLTGPTGAGKSATMYTMIGLLNQEDVNLVTLEDPVEYHFPRVNQVPIQEKTGMTFASGLRSVLRQDPDIIAVGEIRDGMTADIALGAAITGHLVLSTLHCGDSCGAVERLLDMGMERYRIAAALRGVISQRLVRKICPHCREPYSPDAREQTELGLPIQANRIFFRSRGCGHCRHTGYQGRTGVFEILTMTPELRRAVADGLSGPKIRELAEQAGFSPIRDNCLELLESGITDAAEILRVLRSGSV